MECPQSFSLPQAWVRGPGRTVIQTPRPRGCLCVSHIITSAENVRVKKPTCNPRTPDSFSDLAETPMRPSARSSVPIKTASGWSSICKNANPLRRWSFLGGIRPVSAFCWPNNECFQPQATPGSGVQRGALNLNQACHATPKSVMWLYTLPKLARQSCPSQCLNPAGRPIVATRCHLFDVAMTDVLTD